jgi:glycosyltransferase involved in cell wall biosynthesis
MVPRVRVLTVARWYPAHDDPGRGSFVADLTSVLLGAGLDVRVASWEFSHYSERTPASAMSAARRAWAAAVAQPDALNTPTHWGSGVPVARLPALYITGESVRQRIDGHAALLVPFGEALHARWPFDLIHAHTAVPDGAAALTLADRVGVPVVVTEHDRSLRQRLPASEDERAAYRNVVERAASVAAVSAQFRDLLARESGLDASAIGVVSNPIPAAFFARRLDGPRDGDELLYVGARKEDKGIVTLLQAFARVRAARPRLRLRLIGRSPSPADEARWQELSDELGVVDGVSFDPPADRDAVAAAMARAGVFVHPSPFESFGMVAAEALASGLPIAATRSGVEGIVGEDRRFGEIAAGTDPESLAEAILGVVDRRDAYDPEALRQAASRFEASEVARDHVERYQAAIARRRGSGETRDAVAPARTREPDLAGPDGARPDGVGAVLAVGQNAVLAERRIRGLPESLRERVVLATRRPTDALRELLPGRVVELDPVGAYKRMLEALGGGPSAPSTSLGRAARFLRSPGKALERQRLRDDREQVLVGLLEDQVEAAWEALPGPAQPGRVLLAMDVEDVVAARRVLAEDARLAPGSTRWLADRWDAATRAIMASGDT